MAEKPSRSREDLLDRVRGFINLAAGNTPEAKLAAIRACAMIREYQLDVCDPDLIDGLFKEQHRLEGEVKRLTEDPTGMIGALRGVRDSIGQLRSMGQAPSPPQTPANPFASNWTSFVNTGPSLHAGQPVYHSGVVAAKPSTPMTSPIPLTSKFEARCKQCGRPIHVGERCYWQKAVGVWCFTTDCYDRWNQRQANLSTFDPTDPDPDDDPPW